MNGGVVGPVIVFEIERDSAKKLKTEQRRVLAATLLADSRVLGAWLAIENEEMKHGRLERLQVAIAAEDASDGGRVVLPVIEQFGAENRMRLYYSWSGNPQPDIVPRTIMERLDLPYSWNRYVTLGEVFRLPPKLVKSAGDSKSTSGGPE